jgi:RNA polymerase sigma-70 factor (ECF subfamily)
MNPSAQSFEQFYDEVKDRVYRALLVAGRQPVKSEDAVSEAFAKAWEHWSTVGLMDNPVGWVMRTAINRYNSDWRIWHRELQEPPPSGVADPPSVDDEVIRLVWALPKRQRQVVAMRILADLAEDETARLLRISPKTVSVHLHRALITLREELTRALEGEDPWTMQTSRPA